MGACALTGCASACTRPAPMVPLGNVLHLPPKHSRLHGIEAAVPADLFVVIPLAASMIAQMPNVRRQFLVIGGDASAIAIGAQVLGGIKTERRDLAQRSRFLIAPLRTECLRSILDKAGAVLLDDTVESVHVGALPVKVYGHHRANLVRTSTLQRGLGRFGIEVQRRRVDVRQNGSGPTAHNRTYRSEKAERRGDHARLRPNAGGL